MEKPFLYSRAGHPSAHADIFPLGARVHKNFTFSLQNNTIKLIFLTFIKPFGAILSTIRNHQLPDYDITRLERV